MKIIVFLLSLIFFSSLKAQNNRQQFYALNRTSIVCSAIDTDAQAFVTASGITDCNEIASIDTLVKMLKDSSLWSLGMAIYPIIGGTASTHKWNLKDPRDLDAAFRLTFSGTVTHASTGMISNGTTGYGNTYLNPNTSYPSGFMSIGIYSRTNVTGTYVDIGAISATNDRIQIYARFGGNMFGQVNTDNNTSEVLAVANSLGWSFANRSLSTAAFVQRNTSQSSSFSTPLAVVNNNIYVMAQNNSGSAAFFAPRELALIWIGGVLTTGQGITLYNIVQSYQTRRARQV